MRNLKGFFSKDDLWVFHLCFGFLSILMFIGMMAVGPYRPSHSTSAQVFFSCVFLYVGYLYSLIREVLPKMLLGIIAIGAGIFSNWIEIDKIMGNYMDRGERMVIVFAGMAVIAHGFGQLRRAKRGLEVEN